MRSPSVCNALAKRVTPGIPRQDMLRSRARTEKRFHAALGYFRVALIRNGWGEPRQIASAIKLPRSPFLDSFRFGDNPPVVQLSRQCRVS